MSDESQFFQALYEAFKKVDRTIFEESEDVSSRLPDPVPPSTILERIRAKSEEPNTSPFVQFPKEVPEESELRLAARKGADISPENLKKMRDNRDKA